MYYAADLENKRDFPLLLPFPKSAIKHIKFYI